MMTTVYIWICPTHGEVEVLEDLKKAYCPKCGVEMTKKGEYIE